MYASIVKMSIRRLRKLKKVVKEDSYSVVDTTSSKNPEKFSINICERAKRRETLNKSKKY